MTYYKVIYHKEALKFIRQNKTIARFFIKMFEDIANDFKSSFFKYDIKIIKGHTNTYRLRKGKFRAIFKVQDQKLILLVLDIGSRGDIYKDL